MSSKIKPYNVSPVHACSYYPHFSQEKKKIRTRRVEKLAQS